MTNDNSFEVALTNQRWQHGGGAGGVTDRDAAQELRILCATLTSANTIREY